MKSLDLGNKKFNPSGLFRYSSSLFIPIARRYLKIGIDVLLDFLIRGIVY